MAHVQMPSDTDTQRTGDADAPNIDSSWLRTPPGGPQVVDKQSVMELDAALVSLSPSVQKAVTPCQRFAMDDLEAAETLAGFARQSSPTTKVPAPATPFQTYHAPPPPQNAQPQPEPLLSLLTSQHPLLGSAINGSLSAYNVGKTYSSQFRYGAEFVERNIASPVASTVGTAGRITGVENGVRRWLSRGRASPNEAPPSESSQPSASAMSPSSSNASHKRRRDEADADPESAQAAQRSRAGSELSVSQGEYLPAYDANRSPTYSSRDPYPPMSPPQHNLGNSTWQTKLILSTSGLGVAMSGESRRSLKYCLRWLRWGNGRLGRLVYSLQTLLAEYDAAGQRRRAHGGSGSPHVNAAGSSPDLLQLQQPPPSVQPRDQAAITAQLIALRAESERVLKKSIDVISNYTGGALPDNARTLVHRHITSLPQRFAFAWRGEQEALGVHANGVNSDHAMQIDGESPRDMTNNGELSSSDGTVVVQDSEIQKHRDVILAAKRMIVLAREGLEMMGQVSLVVDSTIQSAEEWCERLGRRIPENEDSEIAAAVNGEAEQVQTAGSVEQRQSPMNGRQLEEAQDTPAASNGADANNMQEDKMETANTS